jgi:hypothetical protein
LVRVAVADIGGWRGLGVGAAAADMAVPRLLALGFLLVEEY